MEALSLAVVFRHPALLAMAAALVIIHIACIPVWRKRQRLFLCLTVWAREHGYTPERMRLSSLDR